MSEQLFPVWTEISVNKSFIVYLHDKIVYDEILLSYSIVYCVSALPSPYPSTYAYVRTASQPGGGGGGGTRKNFDRDARVTFLGLKFDNLLFFWVAQNEGYFLGGWKKKHCFFWLIGNLHYFLGC